MMPAGNRSGTSRSTPQADSGWRAHWDRLRREVTHPQPRPPQNHYGAQFRYGFAQPFLGLRTVLSDRALFRIAITPVAILGLFCAFIAVFYLGDEGGLNALGVFFATIIALAPVPPVLFGRHYARLAAQSRPHLGLVPAQPYLRGFFQLLWESVTQVIVLALGVLPLTLLLGLLSWPLGLVMVTLVQGAWALHWIVVEGLDSGRTLAPGQSVEAMEAASAQRPGWPWYHRFYQLAWPAWIGALITPGRMASEITVSLGKHWRVEVDLVEANAWVSVGFGLGSALLLAIPGANLFFRPAVVVGAVHLRAQIERNPAYLPKYPTSAPSRGGTEANPPVPPRI